MISKFSFLPLLLAISALPLPAAVIGTNTPAQPVTWERILTLPKPEQAVWKQYLERSARQSKADHDFVREELKSHGLKAATNAPSARSFGGVPLKRPAAWYAGNEARHIADVMLSFQTPAGGWSKHVNMTGSARAPGEFFTSDENSHYLSAADYDTPHDLHWSYVGTFDNGATTTQLRFLAKVVAALPSRQGMKFRKAFLRGLHYIFSAQYPNGGWPQVWPLQGGYHDAITYNDGAMMHVVELLRDLSEGRNEFAFVSDKIRAEAATSLKRGLDCILATQIVVNDRHTVWCQQHEALTLKPTSARNYEMPSECSAESAEIVLFLMELPDPSPKVIQAVNAAVVWFEKTKIKNVAFRFAGGGGRRLVPSPGSGPIWARYYQIGTDRPIFGDRDKSIHDDLNEISAERRRGYAWYGSGPELVLRRYEPWRKEHPEVDTGR